MKRLGAMASRARKEKRLQKIRSIATAAMVLGCFPAACLALSPPSAASSEGVEQRRSNALSDAIANPFPNPACDSSTAIAKRCDWAKLKRALATLYVGKGSESIRQANLDVQESVPLIESEIAAERGDSNDKNAAYYFHFLTAGLLERIYFLFGSGDGRLSGRLDGDTQEAIARIFWNYAKAGCRVSDADPGQVWQYWASENHNIMRVSACWSAAEILSRDPVCGLCAYDDSSTPATQDAAWTRFLTAYISEHARYGLFVEFFSPYYKYTLQNFYNMADFASDLRLRRLSHSLLDVWWADWAQEQIGGIDAGSKARMQATEIGSNFVGPELAWLYFGIGARMPVSMRQPALIIMETSDYRPPDIVSGIVASSNARDGYEDISRRPGLLLSPAHGQLTELDAERGGILRYVYASRNFVLSTSMFARLPNAAWAPYSSQNRWDGLTMGGGAGQFIFAHALYASSKSKSYNDIWGVQHLGTQIIQKLAQPFGRGDGSMAVWVGPSLKVEQEGAWAFVEASAYVAFRPAFGGFSGSTFGAGAAPVFSAGNEEEGNNVLQVPASDGHVQQFILDDDTAPVIIQAAEKSEYPSFSAFKAAVLSAPLVVGDDRVTFRGLGYAGELTLYCRSGRLPEIDGRPIDLTPDFEFKSPHLNANWGKNEVTIQNSSARIVYSFAN